MCTRVLLAFLALALLLTAFPGGNEASAAAGTVAAQSLPEGSRSDHFLDEQPAQSHSEASADLPELIRAPAAEQRPLRKKSWASGGAIHPRLAPWLDGPKRPPRAVPAFA
jgi:hypothetical protein